MRISTSNKPVACITMGYPAGVGPEIIAKALASPAIRRLANFLIIGDGFVFKKALRASQKELRYKTVESAYEINFSKNAVILLDVKKISCDRFHFGKLSASYAKASVHYIDEAVSLIESEKADIIVTAPIHKQAAYVSGFRYAGHTEYLAHLTNAKSFAMMLTGGPLKVVLATTHLPLKEVSRSLSKRMILNLLFLMNTSLKRYFHLPEPRIAVCGLNPHAGEDGLLGGEDRRIVAPAVKRARRQKVAAYGPLAADAVFYNLYKGCYDAALCMYHDQGLVALKMIARDESANITLGLPFIRTSPGHGTALDIAGEGIASSKSMETAIKTAIRMYKESSEKA